MPNLEVKTATSYDMSGKRGHAEVEARGSGSSSPGQAVSAGILGEVFPAVKQKT